jgi:hypothetical protein
LWQICGDRIHKIDAAGKTLHSIPVPDKHSSDDQPRLQQTSPWPPAGEG